MAATRGCAGRGLIVGLASAELGVAPSTEFRWRHRFLQLAQQVKALVLTGVMEADETFFLCSSKSQPPDHDENAARTMLRYGFEGA